MSSWLGEHGLDALLHRFELEIEANPQYMPDGLLGNVERFAAWFPALRLAVADMHASAIRMRQLVKSPIEELFLAALWGYPRINGIRALTVKGDMVSGYASVSGDPAEAMSLGIEPQAQVGPSYLADFILSGEPMYGGNGRRARIAVELDGHDFHEKTKAQAAKDKKRDRFFVAQDLALLRFTGSEVVKDPSACVAEALAVLRQRMTADVPR